MVHTGNSITEKLHNAYMMCCTEPEFVNVLGAQKSIPGLLNVYEFGLSAYCAIQEGIEQRGNYLRQED